MAKNNIKDRVLLDRGITTMEDLMAVFGDLEKWEKLSQQIDTKSMKKIKDRLLKPEFYQSDLNTDNPDHLPAIERIEWEWYESIYRYVCKIERKRGVLGFWKKEVSQKKNPYEMNFNVRVNESSLEDFFRNVEREGEWDGIPETDCFDRVGSKVYVSWRDYGSNLYKANIGYPFDQDTWLEFILEMIEETLYHEVLGLGRGV